MIRGSAGAKPAGTRARRVDAALPAWCVGLPLLLWLLHTLGTGELSTPPAPWAWAEWLTRVDPAAAIVALLRLAAIVALWYLVLLTIVGAVGRKSKAVRVVEVADRVTPGFLRTILGCAGGLGLSAAGLTLAVAPLLNPVGSTFAPAQAADLSVQASAVDTASIATLRMFAAQEAAPDEGSTATLRRYQFSLAPLTVASPDVDDTVWEVSMGDHLWHIAQETLADAWDRPPTDHEVDRYWSRVIEYNRGELVVVDDPDLIFPGQTIRLPRVPELP